MVNDEAGKAAHPDHRAANLLRRDLGWGWLLLLVIAILGAGGSYTLSERFRTDAYEVWKAEASQSEQWLSGTVLSWLEESYAPLSGIAILFENSIIVTENEFLDAIDSLEARATALFIDTMAIVRPVKDDAGERWDVEFSTNTLGILSPGVSLFAFPAIIEALEVAADQPGQTVLGRPLSMDSGVRYSPVTLAISDRQGELMIVGLMNYDALVGGLFEIHRPRGVSLRINGRFPTSEGPGPEIPVFGEVARDALYSSSTRTVSAGADLSLTWDFSRDFADGPDVELADYSLWSGIGATGFVTLFIAFLLNRNRTIARRVRESTAALKASVDRFSVLFDASADPYLILDGDRFADCNQAAVNLLGYSDKEDLLARHPGELSPEYQPDGEPSRDKAESMIAIALTRGSHRFDWVHHRKGGEEFPVEVTLTPIELDGKTVLLVVWHDLTERQKAGQALHKSEEQFRTLVANIPGTVYRCLPSHPWTMIFISDEIETLSGYPASDFLGENPVRRFGDFMYSEDIERISGNTAEAIAERRSYSNEYRIINSAGEIRSVYAKGQAVYREDGEPQYLDGTIFDITDRIKAEEALRKSEERYALVIRAADEGIWDWDPATGEVYYSPRYKEMLGYRPDEFPDRL